MFSKTKILFQGDSITDAGRNRDRDDNYGCGYPTMIAGVLGLHAPGKYSFLNRGVSGDRVVDLYARWKCDCLNWKPDVLSILVGINDVWHEVSHSNGVETEKYECVYDALLKETTCKLPEVKLIILEPFVLPGTATQEHWDYFAAEVPKRAAVAKRVAQKYGAVFVQTQALFDQVCTEDAGAETWLVDGVHPTAAGHALLAREWLKAFENLL